MSAARTAGTTRQALDAALELARTSSARVELELADATAADVVAWLEVEARNTGGGLPPHMQTAGAILAGTRDQPLATLSVWPLEGSAERPSVPAHGVTVRLTQYRGVGGVRVSDWRVSRRREAKP